MAWSASAAAVLLSGLIAWAEGHWSPRAGLGMGFVNHGGMWSDLALLSAANAVIVPHLQPGPWLLVAMAAGTTASLLVHRFWYGDARSAPLDAAGTTHGAGTTGDAALDSSVTAGHRPGPHANVHARDLRADPAAVAQGRTGPASEDTPAIGVATTEAANPAGLASPIANRNPHVLETVAEGVPADLIHQTHIAHDALRGPGQRGLHRGANEGRDAASRRSGDHMWPARTRGHWSRDLSWSGWAHVLYVAGELALLLGFLAHPAPAAVVLFVAAVFTIHVPIGLLQPRYFLTGDIATVREQPLLLPCLLALWALTLVKM